MAARRLFRYDTDVRLLFAPTHSPMHTIINELRNFFCQSRKTRSYSIIGPLNSIIVLGVSQIVI